MGKRSVVLLGLLCVAGLPVWSSTGASEASMGPLMVQTVLELAVILLATWVGGAAAKRIGLPSALGNLIAGMLIGPFALGGIDLPGFVGGFFPPVAGPIPVSPQLYIFSILASIILLFVSGLETDLSLFKRYAAKGAIVGIGGVVVSFIGASLVSTLLGGALPGSPTMLFMGALAVASSVGIGATILSAKKKIDSPEGTTILSAAVVDDILGIIVLAVVLGISERLAGPAGAQADIGGLVRDVAWIAIRAFGIWLAVTILGLRFARSIGKFLKRTFKDRNQLAVMALGLAFLLAGVFEEAGLSMVIGAYIMGLSLANTDLAFLIQGKLATFKDFLIPIFFAISGMLLNPRYLLDLEVLGFGLVFAVVAILAKLLGSGLPALGLGFNSLGAMRIGMGMVPRAEITLIIAGIGVSTGALSEKFFGVALIMMISSIVVAPPVLAWLLDRPATGMRKKSEANDKVETKIDFQGQEFAELLIGRFTAEMEREGFFVNRMEHDGTLYQMRKDDIFVSLSLDEDGVASILSEPDHVPLFQTALYESLLSVNNATMDLKERFRPESITAPTQVQSSTTTGTSKKKTMNLAPYLSAQRVLVPLKAESKIEAITLLLDSMEQQGVLLNRVQVMQDVLDRENSMSTGMQDGIALPHAKTSGVAAIHIAVGIAPQGIEFQSLDGKPSQLFFLMVSPKDVEAPHLQVLAALSTILKDPSNRAQLLAAKHAQEVISVLTGEMPKNPA